MHHFNVSAIFIDTFGAERRIRIYVHISLYMFKSTLHIYMRTQMAVAEISSSVTFHMGLEITIKFLKVIT